LSAGIIGVSYHAQLILVAFYCSWLRSKSFFPHHVKSIETRTSYMLNNAWLEVFHHLSWTPSRSQWLYREAKVLSPSLTEKIFLWNAACYRCGPPHHLPNLQWEQKAQCVLGITGFFLEANIC
jgi:hypothetical protein